LRIEQVLGTLAPEEPFYIVNHHLGVAYYGLSGGPSNVRRKHHIIHFQEGAIRSHRPGLEDIESSPGDALFL
jgi:hypothetical protein